MEYDPNNPAQVYESRCEQEKKQRGNPDKIKPYQFQPGQSGNPSGRPKKKWLTEVYEELLEEKLSDPEFRKQFKESQWTKLMSEKVVGAMTLDKAWERTEGKVKDEVDMNIKGDIGDILEAIRTRKHGK